MSQTGLVLVKQVDVHNFLDSFVVHAIMKFAGSHHLVENSANSKLVIFWSEKF
jgi:hypothetical protein